MKRIPSPILVLLLGLIWPGAVCYAETVVLSVPGPGSLVYLPVQLAVAIEADRAEGLDLQLRFFSGGPLALRDLNDRNCDFTVAGLPAIASARANKSPILAIGQLSQSAMVSLILRRDLKSKVHNISELKGMRVGVNSSTRAVHSTSQMLTEYLIKRAGLKENDVQIIPAGQTREAQRAALASHSVDAVMGDEPFASELEQQGEASILVDLYNPQTSSALLGGPFVHAALATRDDVLIRFPKTATKMQRVFDRTLQWMTQHSPEEIIAKLAAQPGFEAKNSPSMLTVLKRNPGMYPSHSHWDAQAISTTERFFHDVANDQAETSLQFSEFIDYVQTGQRP